MQGEFRARRDLMLERLTAIPGIRCHVPDGTFYLFPDIDAYLGKSAAGKKIENSVDLAEYLLEKARIATVAGEPFGSPGHIRLSYATSRERIEEGVKRLADALAKLV